MIVRMCLCSKYAMKVISLFCHFYKNHLMFLNARISYLLIV